MSFNVSQRSAAGRSGVVSGEDSDYDLSTGGRRKGRKGHRSSRVDRDDVYNEVDLDDYSAPKVSTEFTTDGEESSNQSADIIAETKYRLKSLEKEAQVSIPLFRTF